MYTPCILPDEMSGVPHRPGWRSFQPSETLQVRRRFPYVRLSTKGEEKQSVPSISSHTVPCSDDIDCRTSLPRVGGTAEASAALQ